MEASILKTSVSNVEVDIYRLRRKLLWEFTFRDGASTRAALEAEPAQ
jgi:hypothetical protein